MQKRFRRFHLAILSILLLIISPIAHAAVTLPFSSSLDGPGCTEGKNLYNNAAGCDGFSNGGNRQGTQCGTGLDSIVLSAANNPLGTGRGVRHYIADGKNNQGGTFMLYLTSLQQELWVRFYIKYPAGYVFTLGSHKLLWISVASGSSKTHILNLGGGFGPPMHGLPDRVMSFWNQGQVSGEDEVVVGTDGYGWNVLRDGNWHAIEMHLKYGVAGYQAVWVDGVQVVNWNLDTTNAAGGWDYIEFQTNADSPFNGACVGIDIDDIALSNGGYIGPLAGGADTTAPAAPSSLAVQ